MFVKVGESWINLANVVRATRVDGDALFIRFVGGVEDQLVDVEAAIVADALDEHAAATAASLASIRSLAAAGEPVA